MFSKYKIEIKWALIFVVVTLLWMVLEKLSGLHGKFIDYHLYLTNLFAIPAVLIYVFALKEKKRVFYSGNMNYVNGLISGLAITIIVALLSPLTQWVISYVITPEYFPNVIKRSVEIGYFPSISEAEAHFNYKNYAIMSVRGALIMGSITSLVVMIFLRSKNKSPKTA